MIFHWDINHQTYPPNSPQNSQDVQANFSALILGSLGIPNTNCKPSAKKKQVQTLQLKIEMYTVYPISNMSFPFFWFGPCACGVWNICNPLWKPWHRPPWPFPSPGRPCPLPPRVPWQVVCRWEPWNHGPWRFMAEVVLVVHVKTKLAVFLRDLRTTHNNSDHHET